MANELHPCRLCLVAPPSGDVTRAAAHLSEALSGGDVASLIITGSPDDPASLQHAAEVLVPIAQANGTAALILNDTRIAGRTRADGIHVDAGVTELTAAVAAFHPNRIVGAGGLTTRHAALIAGDMQPDYVFFGRLDGDTAPAIFPKALDLAAWWASVAVIPAVVMGGSELASVDEAARAGIEFVALSRAVWDDRRGPAAAVAEACDRLAAVREAAA
jgi:thiamine-phosphate pyrophosphorylase